MNVRRTDWAICEDRNRPADDGDPVISGRSRYQPRWLAAIRRYLIAVACGNLLWETAQLPLYTLWHDGPASSIASAVLHCTAGDVVIATVALIGALAVVGSAEWPDESWLRVAVTALSIGVGYTIFSEYLNTVIRRSWTYTELMPTLPWFGTGLAPMAQWVVVPSAALAFAGRRASD
jgi:hypothetical protein